MPPMSSGSRTPNRNVRGADPLGLQAQGFVGYRSLLNYRSPASIAEVIQQALPEFEFVAANDLPGPGVGITSYRDPSEQPRLAGRLVGRLLQQRFRLQDIVILSCRAVSCPYWTQITVRPESTDERWRTYR
jgi:hypothetical protein